MTHWPDAVWDLLTLVGQEDLQIKHFYEQMLSLRQVRLAKLLS